MASDREPIIFTAVGTSNPPTATTVREINERLYCAHSMPGTDLSQALFFHGGNGYYHPHLMDEETEAQRG